MFVIQGRARLAQEQGQRLPVAEHVAHGLAQTGVGLDKLVVELSLHPGLERFHDGLAVGLVMRQPLLGAEPPFLGLGVHPVHMPQGFEHVAALGGELPDEAHELSATMAQAKGQEGGQLRG
ncbi:MAG: hypothetical protein M5U12_09510 [Verrucomicrobia bacterium]|nr:hypothetical protein [Verrucomicrobiota bacterium]